MQSDPSQILGLTELPVTVSGAWSPGTVHDWRGTAMPAGKVIGPLGCSASREPNTAMVKPRWALSFLRGPMTLGDSVGVRDGAAWSGGVARPS
jgi:hypothetical protein